MAYELVVIGASWGGLEALERILGELPAEYAPAVAIALHRSASSDPEGLTALLSRYGRRTVHEAGDKDAVTPGTIFVAPADYHLLVEQGNFALSVDAAVSYSRPSIDVLFDSAATAYGERLVAVVLTGANEDGANGLRRVRRRGGVTIVQDPDSAARREMPEAAIATGAADHVVPLAEIAASLVRCAERGPARRAGAYGYAGRSWGES